MIGDLIKGRKREGNGGEGQKFSREGPSSSSSPSSSVLASPPPRHSHHHQRPKPGHLIHYNAFLITSSTTVAIVPSLSSVVDITTKVLYDRIVFLDVDRARGSRGGRSPTPVGSGTERGSRASLPPTPITISSGSSPCKSTTTSSRGIFSIRSSKPSQRSDLWRRKFIWEEMSYLEWWWRDSTDEKRKMFAKLVKEGQLEIGGGGWVMNDEILETADDLGEVTESVDYYVQGNTITAGNLFGRVCRRTKSCESCGAPPT